ncbi:MAG: ABC transporter permease [Marmoricola sp.]
MTIQEQTLTAPPTSTPTVQRSRPESGTGFVREWLWGDLRSRVATGFLVLIIVIAACAPFVARYSPSTQGFAPFSLPSWQHWLGTDDLGRDVWARLVFGARASLTSAVIAVGVAVLIGVPTGLVAGFRGGWVDGVIMRVADTLLSFPGIVIAIAITAVMGPGLVHSMTAVGIVFSPSVARVTRGQVLVTKERSYIDAARSFGSPAWRIVIRHVLPNSIQPVVIQSTFMLGMAVIAEASLSFVGLGVQYPSPSFGVMLQRAAQFISLRPSGVYAPGLAIAFTVLAFNALGDSLRDVLDPTARTRRRLRRAAPRARRFLLRNRRPNSQEASRS